MTRADGEGNGQRGRVRTTGGRTRPGTGATNIGTRSSNEYAWGAMPGSSWEGYIIKNNNRSWKRTEKFWGRGSCFFITEPDRHAALRSSSNQNPGHITRRRLKMRAPDNAPIQ